MQYHKYRTHRESAMPPTRKLSFEELRDIVGELAATDFREPAAFDDEDWAAYTKRREAEEQAARRSLNAYYLGRIAGVVNTQPSEEDVAEYAELVRQHTEQMLALYDGADVIAYPTFAESEQQAVAVELPQHSDVA